ncbi:histidinol-phosphate aminotransferase family protein [Aquimarina sp. AD1]|uniref:pyridoxal phosphate-dependent aminotransferase n=1 Tax=Aquimarina sp. (strain AD1) TaxID=1714848 RepID=UPI000E4F7DF3|nr:histidinol-phosphate transaminase [Aquimarina sp. AD1]AXT55417.1 histidinol-phosphate aminotransferase family protein [Aquimarina sp. AD1]RKN14540.1 aminotransferase class I/II-fold pyridoxal phosphate-dependent enzyme [Aquimarina sp. AD1]
MKATGFNRRKFLQLGSTLAVASTISPISYGATLLDKNDVKPLGNDENIRLFSNENPYGPSQKVLDAITNNTNRVNRYASFHSYSTDTLKEKIAKINGIEKDQVIFGHGSFEILCMLTRTFGQQRDGIIVPATTFNVTAAFADRIFDHKVKRILLTDGMDIDLETTKKEITKNTKLVYICNPNNPTGKSLPAAKLESFCKELATTNCTIAIDEAYIELMESSRRPDTIELLKQKYNVLIIRTFSKAFGLAGLRVGYAMGLPETIAKLNHDSYTFSGLIGNPGIVAAITALDDIDYVDEYRKKNVEVRTYMESSLKKMGLKYLKSDTNFMLIEVKDVKRLKEELVPFGIAIFPSGGKHYPTWARISIGTLQEMKIFFNAINTMNWLTS